MRIGSKNGFSLIELLVVVTIVGIVAVLAVPMYKRAIVASENTSAYTTARVMVQVQTSFYSHKSRYARLDELNEGFSNNLGTLADNSILKGNYIFTMSPEIPTDGELKENFTIVATRTIDNLDLPYVISVDASGEIVQ